MNDFVEYRIIDDTCVVTFQKRVILSQIACDDIALCFRSLDYGRYHIVVDFHIVELYASAALQPLLDARAALTGTGKRLVMINVRDDVYKMFEMTKMSRDFHRFESLELAQEALRQAA